ncbi:MAG: zinc-ribbon domain-containing protein [Firmicutes bacterium]|nr:zinc-ribbon domain-containing protein [Bacillota bacterium]
MAFCIKCGQEMDESDRFCTNCGTTNPTAGGPSGQANPSVSKVQAYFGEMKDLVLGVILAPIASTRAVARNPYFEVSFITALTLVLIQGLLAMWAAKVLVGSAADIVREFLPYSSRSRIDIPYGRIFLSTCLMSTTAFGGMFAGTALVGRYLFGGRGSSLSAWNAVVASSVPMVCGFALAIVATLITWKLGIVFIWMGSILSMLCVYAGVMESMDISENRAAFSVPLIYAVMFIVQYIVLSLFS